MFRVKLLVPWISLWKAFSLPATVGLSMTALLVNDMGKTIMGVRCGVLLWHIVRKVFHKVHADEGLVHRALKGVLNISTVLVTQWL